MGAFGEGALVWCGFNIILVKRKINISDTIATGNPTIPISKKPISRFGNDASTNPNIIKFVAVPITVHVPFVVFYISF